MLLENKIFRPVRDFFSDGSVRTQKIKRNVLGMLFMRGGNIIIGLLLVPITLSYVDDSTYGIWLALSSMIVWISFFDIGVNNGLKNKLAEAFANEDYALGKKYVSTTYAILSIIFIPIMVLLLVVSPIIDWTSLLNLPSETADGLLASIAVIISFFCINFILNTINVVLLADQRPADSAFRQFVQQLTSLIIIWVLTLTTKGNLLYLCLGLCVSPLLVSLVFNFTLFRGKYRAIAPSWGTIDFRVAPDLLKVGIQFFIIQIAAVIQYQMINFLLIRYYGASEVTSYNICYKYFSVLTMVWGTIVAPIWVAVTDSITSGDYNWIRQTIKKYMTLFLVFVLLGCLMLAISPWAFNIWIGNKSEVPFILSVWVLIYCIVLMFAQVFVNVVNGSGELKLQMIASLISPIVFIAVFMSLYSWGVGVYSVLIAAILSNFNGLIIAPIQCRGIVARRTTTL